MYCKRIPLVRLNDTSEEFEIFKPGNQYLILDAGGNAYYKLYKKNPSHAHALEDCTCLINTTKYDFPENHQFWNLIYILSFNVNI